MKTINFWTLPTYIKTLTFDGDKTDFRLHCDEMPYFGARTKEDYEHATNRIDTLGIKGNGWQIYCGYDVSGFSYWMENMQEQNYISITVSFDNIEIDRKEISKIKTALYCMAMNAKNVADNYNYDPMDLATITNED